MRILKSNSWGCYAIIEVGFRTLIGDMDSAMLSHHSTISADASTCSAHALAPRPQKELSMTAQCSAGDRENPRNKFGAPPKICISRDGQRPRRVSAGVEDIVHQIVVSHRRSNFRRVMVQLRHRKQFPRSTKRAQQTHGKPPAEELVMVQKTERRQQRSHAAPSPDRHATAEGGSDRVQRSAEPVRAGRSRCPVHMWHRISTYTCV
ncbi:hypothetical protein BC834DRAFT_476986 [Gloeopeniophorella convolvens]|nr:hypothetical protein BC834DRAFT_476986 [Gloeopeniophorella convolvens]